MGKNLLLFFVVSTLVSLSSCVSVHIALIHYKLEFGKILKVRILQNEYPKFGVLSL